MILIVVIMADSLLQDLGAKIRKIRIQQNLRNWNWQTDATVIAITSVCLNVASEILHISP